MDAWSARITYWAPDLVPQLSRGPSPALARARAPAAFRCVAERFPRPAAAPASRAGRRLAAVAGFDPGLPGLAVAQELASRRACSRSRLPVAQGPASGLAFASPRLPVATAVSLERPGGSAATALERWNAAYPAAWDFCPEVFPAVPAPMAQAPFAPLVPDSAAALWHRAAGNDNFDCAAPAAVPPADTDRRNTSAGRQAAGPAPERNCGSTCPIRDDAAPIDCPSARPSAAAHPRASRESTREDAGSSAPGRAARTTAHSMGPPAPRARCTRNSRTSCLLGRPSTCRRKKRSSNPVAARSRRGNQAPGPVPGTWAG